MEEKDQVKVCVICGEKFTGWGNNPDPIADHGECCDECNLSVVIPARLGMLDL